MDDGEQDVLREGLKRVAVSLKEAGLPFALSGSYAAWAYGAPEPGHDVDFIVAPEDAARAAEELSRRGLNVYQPPEDWLFKVAVDGAAVDVIHRATGATVHEILADANELSVLSVIMPVMSPTDVTTEKLLSLDEHYCDLASVLPIMRALRERVNWEVVRRRAAGHPFAEAVLFLLERLNVVGDPARS